MFLGTMKHQGPRAEVRGFGERNLSDIFLDNVWP